MKHISTSDVKVYTPNMDVIELVCSGNVNVATLEALTYHHFRFVVATAGIHGQTDVLRMCAATNKWSNAIDARRLAYWNVCKYGHLETLKYLVSIAHPDHMKEIAMCVYKAAVKCERYNIIEWWMTHECTQSGLLSWFSHGTGIQTAIYFGQVAMLEWLISKGVFSSIDTMDMHTEVNSETKHRILRVLHVHRFPGIYQVDCNAGTCSVCREERIWDMWEMDTTQFTEHVQWLPREMVEDTLGLVL